LWWQKKGSGDLTIGFACDQIPRFWEALIVGDEPKEVLIIIIIIIKDLWDYVNQLDIRINHMTHVSYEQITIKTCSAQYFKGLPWVWLKTRVALHTIKQNILHVNSY